MKKKYRKKVFFATQYDAGAIQQFLEEMAALGYMFVKNQGIFFCFEECQPRKLKFQVDYFDKATIMDTNPEEKTLEYIEFCRECGWEHIFSNGKMQIFYSEKEDITPLHTDERIKLKYIVKNTIFVYGIQWFFLPFMYLFTYIISQFSRIFETGEMSAIRYATMVTNGTAALVPLIVITYILYSIVSIVRFMKFYLKNRQRVNNEETIEYYSYDNTKKFSKLSIGYILGIILVTLLSFCNQVEFMVIMAVSFLFMFGLIMAATKLSQSKYANRVVNIVTSIVIGVGGAGLIFTVLIMGIMYMSFGNSKTIVKDDVIYSYSWEEIPVTLEMLGVNSLEYEFLYEERYKDKYKSPWAEYISYGNYYVAEDGKEEELPYLSIDIFQSSISEITDKYTQKWLQDTFYNNKLLSEEIAERWGVEKAYTMTSKDVTEEEFQLLFIKDEKVIIISGNFEVSEQAKEALKSLY